MDDWKYCEACLRDIQKSMRRQGVLVIKEGEHLIKSPKRAQRRARTDRKLQRRILQIKNIFNNGFCYQWDGFPNTPQEECDPYRWNRPFGKYRDRHVINWKGGRYGNEDDPGHYREREGWKWDGDLEDFGDTQRGKHMRHNPPYRAREK